MTQVALAERGRPPAKPSSGVSIASGLTSAENALAVLHRPGDPEDFLALAGKARSDAPDRLGPESAEQWAKETKAILARLPRADQLIERTQAINAALEAPPNRRGTHALVAMLCDAYPTGRPANPTAYIETMVHDLVSMGFSPVVVALACQTIRRASKWLPSVAEVVEAATKAREQIARTREYAEMNLRDVQIAAMRVERIERGDKA